MRLLLVLCGGAAGSAARYLAGIWLGGWLGVTFPWGTLFVNILGSLLIGIIATLADESGWLSADTRILLVTGFLGGFTTFSSFALESLRLAEQRDLLRTLLYVSITVTAGFAAAAVGIAATRHVTGR